MAYVTNLLVRLDSFKGTESLLRRVTLVAARCSLPFLQFRVYPRTVLA